MSTNSTQHHGANNNSKSGVETLPMYAYSTLRNPDTDIRLLEIQPGEPGDDIRIRITYSALQDEDQRKPTQQPTRATVQQLKATLPEGFNVAEVLDGRYVFINDEPDAENPTSWDHPDPTVDRKLYERPVQADPDPRYEALSYTWGPKVNGAWISISEAKSGSGLSTAYKISCQPNLMDALQRLRSPSQPRIFWIDAICINQDDDVEKAIQVRRMTSIYKHAYRVVVWLGNGGPDHYKALKALDYIGRQVVVALIDVRYQAPDSTEKDWHFSGTKVADDETMRVIKILASMEWFKRLWIVQEACLANPVTSIIQCGSLSIPLTIFWTSIYVIWDNQNFGPRDVNSAQQVLSAVLDPSFGNQVGAASWRPCFDPRDKVYGLLGICGPRLREAIRPNYHSTWTAADVYRQAVLAHIEITQRIELMDCCGIASEKNISAPSWVPDWSVKAKESSWVVSSFAAGYSRADVVARGQGVLEAWGVRCGSITRTSKVIDTKVTADAIVQIGAGVEGIFSGLRDKITDAAVVTNLLATLTMGGAKDYYEDGILGDSGDIDSWVKVAGEVGLLGPIPGTDGNAHVADVDEQYAQDLDTLVENCYLRKIVYTDSGHIGLCPKETVEGDIVVVLLGCSSPVVLRETAGGCIVVGHCYFHSMGFASQLLGDLPSPWTPKYFSDDGWWRVGFYNSDTEEQTWEDPRLGPLEDGWERYPDHEIGSDEPEAFDYFRRVKHGKEEVVNYDPRMSLNALLSRGLKLENLSLV
ncbi:hypothetical protein V492_03959 [Pseudogymnoascus sp. VKM F-4246]|nr:hypothetical protein V492_03959 [Pseudogymnoascus sp. VKM F-4246]